MIDLDGVCYDFVGEFRNFCELELDRNLPRVVDWNFYSVQWGLSVDEFLDLYASAVNYFDLFSRGTPLPGSLMLWQELQERGHHLHVVTDRSPRGAAAKARAQTLKWLGAWGLAPDSVQFSADKTVIKKVSKTGFNIAIDDRWENVRDLREANVLAYCLRQPWNDNRDLPYVESLTQFIEKVDYLANA